VSRELDLDLDGLPAVLVARPQGDIDMATAPVIESHVVDAIEQHRPACVLVDLGAADYMDSSGIRLLFRLYALLEADPSRLVVVAPPGSSAERLLRLVALGDIGDIRPSVASALEACQGPAPH
jgi:anti-anti-sigma factor